LRAVRPVPRFVGALRAAGRGPLAAGEGPPAAGRLPLRDPLPVPLEVRDDPLAAGVLAVLPERLVAADALVAELEVPLSLPSIRSRSALLRNPSFSAIAPALASSWTSST